MACLMSRDSLGKVIKLCHAQCVCVCVCVFVCVFVCVYLCVCVCVCVQPPGRSTDGE
jgi:hypothetical protein